MQTAQEAVAGLEALPADEKAKAKIALGYQTLPPPTGGVVGVLWIIVVGALAIVLVAGGVGLYFLERDGISTEVLLPIVTASLTALVGLLAPSPVAGNQ